MCGDRLPPSEPFQVGEQFVVDRGSYIKVDNAIKAYNLQIFLSFELVGLVPSEVRTIRMVLLVDTVLVLPK